MSLVNDMLRDLEGQRGRARADLIERESLLGDGGLLAANPATTWLPALAAFVLVGGLLLWQANKKQSPENSATASVNATAIAKVEAKVKVNSDEQSAAANKSELTFNGAQASIKSEMQASVLSPNYYAKLIQPQATPVQDNQWQEAQVQETVAVAKQVEPRATQVDQDRLKQQQIAQLLNDAERALSVDRLLTPKQDNAFDRYQRVLELSPGHVEATAGLQSIARRYINLATDYAAEGNFLRAKVLLKRAEGVMPENIEIQREIEQAQAEIMPPAMPEKASQPKDAARLSSAPQSQVSIVPTSNWRDLNNAKQAQTLWAEGKSEQALAQLQNYLQRDESAHNSFDLLFHLLLEAGHIEAAEASLQQVKGLSASEHKAYLAYLLEARGEITAAIELLESGLSGVDRNPSYRALLAGFYQKAGNYSSAATSYRQLLQQDDTKPEYWLGLAVALDAQAENQQALKAFQRALSAEQSPQVQQYIAGRIRALSVN